MDGEKRISELTDTIINIAIEAWRFRQVFESAMNKLDPTESRKYLSKYNWFQRKVNDALTTAGLRCIDLEGQEYTEGLPVFPINIDDFDSEDWLYIEKMLEPIIMENDHLMKSGTVILGKKG